MVAKVDHPIGTRFDRLVTTSEVYSRRSDTTSRAVVDVVCDCGTKVSAVSTGKLRRGHKKSCGCLRREQLANRPRNVHKLKYRGYVLVHAPDHPNAWNNGWVYEHIKVMSDILGRPLMTPTENVHHKNGVRDDNRPDNLELWSSSQPAGQRVEDKVAWALELLSSYAPERLVTE